MCNIPDRNSNYDCLTGDTARRFVVRRLIVPFITIFLLILAACGGGGGGTGGGQQGLTGRNSYIACPGSTNTTAAAPESGTVTLTVSGWSSTPAEDALVQDNLNTFQQSHPNIKIN